MLSIKPIAVCGSDCTVVVRLYPESLEMPCHVTTLEDGHGVCGRGIGRNSTQCTKCLKWVLWKCSGIKVA